MPTGAGQPRTYSVVEASEIPAGMVNTELLTDEINNDPALAGATLDRIDQNGNDVNVWFTANLSAAEITALDALLFNHSGVVTSPAFQFWEDNPIQSTTSETYVNAMTRTAAPMQQGPYILTFSLEMQIAPVGPVNSAGQMRFQVDGVSKALHTHFHEEWAVICGWDRFFANEGEEIVLTLDWRRNPNEGGNDAIEVRRLKLGLERKDEA